MLTTTPMLFLPFILTPKKKIPTTYASSRTQDMKIKGKKCMESCKIMIDFKIIINVIAVVAPRFFSREVNNGGAKNLLVEGRRK